MQTIEAMCIWSLLRLPGVTWSIQVFLLNLRDSAPHAVKAAVGNLRSSEKILEIQNSHTDLSLCLHVDKSPSATTVLMYNIVIPWWSEKLGGHHNCPWRFLLRLVVFPVYTSLCLVSVLRWSIEPSVWSCSNMMCTRVFKAYIIPRVLNLWFFDGILHSYGGYTWYTIKLCFPHKSCIDSLSGLTWEC